MFGCICAPPPVRPVRASLTPSSAKYSACAPVLRFRRLLANMAAPALSSRAGSAGNSPTATPNSTKHVPQPPELDFRSGTRIEELNRLITEFSKHEQREYDDQRALEIHTAKDFIFSMLGEKELCLVLALIQYIEPRISCI